MSKKQEIITIARGIIHSKGYQATSISDILNAASIGKGQFYHYFTSKYDLGLAVVEDLVQDLDQQLIKEIFQSKEEAKKRLNKMLDWNLASHTETKSKLGCAVGNLAIEMSEHDETFRVKIKEFFNKWISEVAASLTEMVEENQLDPTINCTKSAQAIVAMIEGGILLMKNQQDIEILATVMDIIRKQYHLI
ncbi:MULTISPECIES: TetR/AcrR family transcriptional regulator [Bacillaceae]|uniref:TetR/AcrR family transcriptional repressor of nem operon n=1 Tax=Peribacillus huizhouensis TaxID=1501239 RepID=A0ABR6CLA8_9BACI|nr:MULTISPECIES: TetR/AcrR family transcriptional regulator [Bacillaceae]MBA9025831.1 TetR/AcrR family transcriptional repressor of nem operon [Peribacillus huizhouensis]